MRKLFTWLSLAICAAAVPGPSQAQQQYSGYVCEVRYIPVSGAYGTAGHIQLSMYTAPGCRGRDVIGVATYHLTQGAIYFGNQAYLLSENQILGMLQNYSLWSSTGRAIRINTVSFGGGLQVMDTAFVAR